MGTTKNKPNWNILSQVSDYYFKIILKNKGIFGFSSNVFDSIKYSQKQQQQNLIWFDGKIHCKFGVVAEGEEEAAVDFRSKCHPRKKERKKIIKK